VSTAISPLTPGSGGPTLPAVPIHVLGKSVAFPDPEEAESDGLLAVGGDLSTSRLLEAYRHGIFPWPWGEGQPMTWYSPPQRCIFEPGGVRVNRSLRRTLMSKRFECRIDTCFADVVRGCAKAARPGQSGTWITGAVARAYGRLHRLGHAHSVEAWQNDHLAGGLYGLAIGGAFFAESMFHREPDASKFALHSLSELLLAQGFTLIDAQVASPLLMALGAISIPRPEFLRRLRDAIALPVRFETLAKSRPAP